MPDQVIICLGIEENKRDLELVEAELSKVLGRTPRPRECQRNGHPP